MFLAFPIQIRAKATRTTTISLLFMAQTQKFITNPKIIQQHNITRKKNGASINRNPMNPDPRNMKLSV
jgi:hypothetical protein